MKILLIEDEENLREVITEFLEKERYVVEHAKDIATARQKTALYEYDCILLDIMLPDGNGLDFLKMLKSQHRDENVIIISARDAIDDKVTGLDLGADDYLPKPFHLSELSARIRSVIRRKEHQGENTIQLANVKIMPDTFQVFVDGNPVNLNRKEYDILLYFTGRPGHLIDKTIMAEAVWGDHIDQVDSFDFIYAQIKNLRKKLKEAGSLIEIKAVYGFGYKLVIDEE